MKDKNTTKKQHYIPQVYLRGFSPEYVHKNNKIPLSKYMICLLYTSDAAED